MVDIAANNWTEDCLLWKLVQVWFEDFPLFGNDRFHTSWSRLPRRSLLAVLMLLILLIQVVWPHNKDLVVGKSTVPETKWQRCVWSLRKPRNLISLMLPSCANMALHNCHFTDAANVHSIKLHGLMSGANLMEKSIESKMNSDALWCTKLLLKEGGYLSSWKWCPVLVFDSLIVMQHEVRGSLRIQVLYALMWAEQNLRETLRSLCKGSIKLKFWSLHQYLLTWLCSQRSRSRKREQVKRRGGASQAVISKAQNSSSACCYWTSAAGVQSGPVWPDVLESVGRRLFFQFVAWLLSRLICWYFDLMMFVTFALADSLQRSCSALPFHERMQMCRSLRLWYSMNSPPPLALNDDGDKCEFAAPVCASRRCAKHAQEEKYVCNCWIGQVSTARKAGVPERRMQQKDVKQKRCAMPKLPRDPRCADCQTGVIICKHRGKCQPVYIACPRDRCDEQECLKLVCCVAMPVLQITPPEPKTMPLVVVSCVESKNASTAAATAVPVTPLFFRAIAQLLLQSQNKKPCCILCKVENASESGRSDPKLSHMEWSEWSEYTLVSWTNGLARWKRSTGALYEVKDSKLWMQVFECVVWLPRYYDDEYSTCRTNLTQR